MKKIGKWGKMDKDGENSGLLSLLPVNHLTATDCKATTCAIITLHQNTHKVPLTKPTYMITHMKQHAYYISRGRLQGMILRAQESSRILKYMVSHKTGNTIVKLCIITCITYTSLAAKGALAHHPQPCTACDISLPA